MRRSPRCTARRYAWWCRDTSAPAASSGVQRLTVQREPSSNYFQAVAYRLLSPEAGPDTAGPAEGLQLGSVALSSDVLRPADGATVPTGPTTISGYAYAGDQRRVSRVESASGTSDSWLWY